MIKVTTRACIKATIAIISLKVVGISQTLISTVPNPGCGLISHQRSLTELIIPNSVETIYINVFSGCKKLTKIIYTKAS